MLHKQVPTAPVLKWMDVKYHLRSNLVVSFPSSNDSFLDGHLLLIERQLIILIPEIKRKARTR
jgi:hypothetical protein